jgi:hypothetical protein
MWWVGMSSTLAVASELSIALSVACSSLVMGCSAKSALSLPNNESLSMVIFN